MHLDEPVQLDVMYKEKFDAKEIFITLTTNKVCFIEATTADWNLDEISMGANPSYTKPKLRVNKYRSKFKEQKVITEDRI